MGEQGCASGNIRCTYNSTTVSSVDQWWLAHMAAGAKAVLIENRVTAWTYTYTQSGEVPTLTPTGQMIVAASEGESQGCGTPSMNMAR